MTMDYYNNSFNPEDLISDNCRPNINSFSDIYPSPSSSPTYQAWMSDVYNIKLESVLPPDRYPVPPSPPDSYQSVASPKLYSEQNSDISTDDKRFFTTNKLGNSIFNESDVNMEPIISLVLEEAKFDSRSICEHLNISLSMLYKWIDQI